MGETALAGRGGALCGTYGPGESSACTALSHSGIWSFGWRADSLSGDIGEPAAGHRDGVCAGDASGSGPEKLSHGDPGAVYAHPGAAGGAWDKAGTESSL